MCDTELFFTDYFFHMQKEKGKEKAKSGELSQVVVLLQFQSP